MFLVKKLVRTWCLAAVIKLSCYKKKKTSTQVIAVLIKGFDYIQSWDTKPESTSKADLEFPIHRK